MWIYINNISRLNHKSKIFYYFAVTTIIFVILFLNNTSYTRRPIAKYKIQYQVTSSESKKCNNVHKTRPRVQSEAMHILLWTNPYNFPFVYFGKGNTEFIKRKCEWTNCYVTGDRQYLGHYAEFDVVAFNGPQLMEDLSSDDLPKHRSPHQKYVYANIEAATNYPICSNTWDNFFNWTWTYKLNSDAVWGYMLVKNSSGCVVAPSVQVDWIDTDKMDPVDDSLLKKLQTKKKAVAWFVSNCNTISAREKFVAELRLYMNYYNIDVDIYGMCGSFSCPKETTDMCLNILERDYYFYLAFENALSEDYVTEKVLNALNHYTVPVVFGGANYSRFLPPNSYLDARELGARRLAQSIYENIQDPEKYQKFFKWRKYYSFHFRHESPETDDYCRFCAMINDQALMNKTTIYNDLSEWWTTDKICTNLTSQSIK